MKKGFTLLEIIIVIIIIGVLTSLALPRLMKTIQGVYAAEAFAGIATLRTAMERCYLMNDGSYRGCYDIDNPGVEDPSNAPNSHFNYAASHLFGGRHYYAATVRNCLDGGNLVFDDEAGFEETLQNLNVVIYASTENGYAGDDDILCGGGLFSSVSSCDWQYDWDFSVLQLIAAQWGQCN